MMKKLLISLALGFVSAFSIADDFGVERVSCAACMIPADNTKAPTKAPTPVKIDAPKPTKQVTENAKKAPNVTLPETAAPQPSLLPSLASKMALSDDAVEPQAVKTTQTTVKKPAQATAQKPKAVSKPTQTAKPKTIATKTTAKAVTVAKPATTRAVTKTAAKPAVKKAVPNPTAVAQQATQPKPAIKQPNVVQPKPQGTSTQPNTLENKILSLGEGLVQ